VVCATASRDSSTRALRRPRPDPRARSAAGRWVLRHRALPRALSLNKDSEGGTPPAAEATRKPAPSPSDRVSRTRDGWTDSKRGHHDFQSWTEIALTRLKVLQFRGFAGSTGDEPKSAISILCSRIQAPKPASVPKHLYGPTLSTRRPYGTRRSDGGEAGANVQTARSIRCDRPH
jgi:hypothetical protein